MDSADNLATVQRLIAAFNRNDLDAVLACMSDDCRYHNIPMQPAVGKPAIRAALLPFMAKALEIDWVVHAAAVAVSGQVFTERTDRFRFAHGWLELPVAGVFDIRNGVICGWRDYFDLQQFVKQLPADFLTS